MRESRSSAPPAWPWCVDFAAGNCRKYQQKRETRPGGQPDGSSCMGAWGRWALAPDTTSMGRDYRSHTYSVAAGVPHVQRGWRIFLTFWQEFLDRELPDQELPDQRLLPSRAMD